MEKSLTEKKMFVSKVIKEGDDLVMLLPNDLLEIFNLEEDAIYIWQMNDDGSFSIIKSNIKSGIGKE